MSKSPDFRVDGDARPRGSEVLGAQDADCVPPRANPRGLRGGGSIFFWVRGSDTERQKLGTGLLAGETSVNGGLEPGRRWAVTEGLPPPLPLPQVSARLPRAPCDRRGHFWGAWFFGRAPFLWRRLQDEQFHLESEADTDLWSRRPPLAALGVGRDPCPANAPLAWAPGADFPGHSATSGKIPVCVARRR